MENVNSNSYRDYGALYGQAIIGAAFNDPYGGSLGSAAGQYIPFPSALQRNCYPPGWKYENGQFVRLEETYSVFVPAPIIQTLKKEEPMKLTSAQKALVVYTKARGIDPSILSLLFVTNPTLASAETVDKMVKYDKLITAYDPTDDEEDEDKKDA